MPKKDKSVGLVVLVESDGCFFVELRVLVTKFLANNWDTFNHKCKRELPPASSKWPFDHPNGGHLTPEKVTKKKQRGHAEDAGMYELVNVNWICQLKLRRVPVKPLFYLSASRWVLKVVFEVL